MQRNLLIVTILLLIISCKSENGSMFTVSGSVKNLPAKMIYLEEVQMKTMQKIVKDSAAVDRDGKFSLKTRVTEESVFNLRLDNEDYPFVSLINDARAIIIDADFKNEKEFYTVNGSAASQGLKEYLAKSGEKIRTVYDLSKELDSVKGIIADSNSTRIVKEKKSIAINELKTYTEQSVQASKSPALAMFILSTYQGMANNPNFHIDPFSNDHLLGILNELVTKFPGRSEIATIRNSFEGQISKSGWVGKPAPEISLPDTEGNPVKLSSFRGKYVLVDFWASWCGPCRRENPNVVEAFNKFRNKNFTILGVSLDLKKEAWMKAIVDDNLNWTHVSDLKQWSSEVVPLYGIQGIPFNVLIDPDGKVLAENLRGNELEKKLLMVLK